MGVRKKLVALVLLALAPLVVLDGVQIYNRVYRRGQEDLQASLELAEAIGAAFDNYLDSLWTAELALGAALTQHGASLPRAEASDVLRAQLAEHPAVGRFTWLDPAGEVLASTDSRSYKVRLADREHLLSIMAGQTTSISDLLQSRITGEPVIVVSRGIRRDDRLVGIIMAAVDVRKLGLALPVERRGGRSFGLIDRQGMVVYRSTEPDLPWEQRHIGSVGPAIGALRGEKTVVPKFLTPVDNTPRMGAAVPVPAIGWAAFATSTLAEVQALARADTQRDIAVMALAVIVSGLGVAILGRRIVRPILSLQAAALGIAGGELGARVELAGEDEVAAAARTFNEMADRIQESEAQLRTRAEQQGAIAALGQHALAGIALPAVMDEAVHLLTELLRVEHCKVLELLPDGQALLLRAGSGWEEGQVGHATLPADLNSQAGYSLLSQEPVMVEDIQTETRFRAPRLLLDHGVVSGMSVIIHGPAGPYGVLGAHTTARRVFTQDDVHFLQAVANVLGTAIERAQAEAERAELLAAAQAARADAEAAQQRLAFLAEASALLAGSLDYQKTLGTLAQMAVARMADWCIVGILEPDGRIQRVAAAHSDPAKQSLLEALLHYPPGPDDDRPVSRVMRTGRSELFSEVTDSLAGSTARSSGHASLLAALGRASAMTVPLTVGGRILGTVSFVSADPARRYDRADLALAEDLARRAAVAVENARLYSDLQEALAARNQALADVEAERQRLYNLIMQAPAMICINRGPDFVYELVNPLYQRALGGYDPTGESVREVLPEFAQLGGLKLLEQVYQTGDPYSGSEVPIRVRRPDGTVAEGYANVSLQPLRGADGQVEGLLTYMVSATEQVRARQAVEAMAAELRTRARQQAAVAELGRLALEVSSRSLPWIGEAARVVADILEVEFCSILELRPDMKTLLLRGGSGWPDAAIGRFRTSIDMSSQAAHTLRTGGPVVVADLRAHPEFQVPPELAARGVVSALSVVIQGQKRSLGVLAVHSTRLRQFTADDINFLQAVAHTMGATVERGQTNQRMEAQHAISRVLAGAASFAEAAPKVLQAAGEGLWWDMGALWLVDRSTGELRCTDLWRDSGVPEPQFAALSRELSACSGHGRLGEGWRGGQPRWVADLAEEGTLVRPEAVLAAGVRSAVWVPISVGSEVLGALEFFFREVRGPNEETLSVLTTIGSQVGQFMERIRAEAELRTLNAELEGRVAGRTAELAAANQELEAFSYSVSHDLRAPLRTIDGFSQAIMEDCASALGGEGQDYLRRIRGASRRMAQLIDDLLRLSRVMRSEMRREEVDLSALTATVAAELARADPDRRGVRFIIESGLKAHGDERLLRVALENLLGNAWKFTSRKPEATIAFGRTEHGGRTAYFVRDDGVGFDMAYAEQLFGAFQRLHSPAEFDGSGVGLATVQRIIHRHGGQVWAEAMIGRGATFYFTL